MASQKSFLFLLLLLLLLSLILPSCSGKPGEEFFLDDIRRMVLIDREIGFREEVTGIEIIQVTKYKDQVEVQVRVTGWAIHHDLTIGATLPASAEQKPSWAIWTYFCREADKNWVVDEKYKVEEGFL